MGTRLSGHGCSKAAVLAIACALAVGCSAEIEGAGQSGADAATAGGGAASGGGAGGAGGTGGSAGGTGGASGGGGGGGSGGGLDAGVSPDAGDSGAVDAGAASDAGAPDVDAALALDGSVPADAASAPSGPNVDRSNPGLHEFTLDPSVLDPAASDFISDQFAQLDTRAEPLGKLVFFLPGANNTPSDWRNHGRKLAEFGFHVVIPHYDNSWGDACSGQGGSCNADTRWEALTGEDTSSVIDVSRADSAEARVLAMLEHLKTADPGGDWGYYLNADGSLRDAEVIIAGISHGATSTGLFASRRSFWRAVMHSGGYGAVGASPATPVSRYYGLSHTEDPQHAAHLSSWEAAGMPGAPTSIDGQTPPFGDAHRLITSEPNTYPHCSVVVHSSSPTDASGNYIFEPAWRYMYGVDELP